MSYNLLSPVGLQNITVTELFIRGIGGVQARSLLAYHDSLLRDGLSYCYPNYVLFPLGLQNITVTELFIRGIGGVQARSLLANHYCLNYVFFPLGLQNITVTELFIRGIGGVQARSLLAYHDSLLRDGLSYWNKAALGLARMIIQLMYPHIHI